MTEQQWLQSTDPERMFGSPMAPTKSGKQMRVYISGPYTRGDVCLNVREAIRAADQVLASGHWPYCPHLTHLWHLIAPKTYEVWLAVDLAWLPCCDCLIRLPGESAGADREVECAKQHGLPVYLGVTEFLLATETRAAIPR